MDKTKPAQPRINNYMTVSSYDALRALDKSVESAYLKTGNEKMLFVRHRNPTGKIGGFVAATAAATGNAHISKDVIVADNAMVSENAMMIGNILVCGSAKIYGNALVVCKSHRETLVIRDNVQIYGNAMVYGSSEISNSIRIY